MDYNYNLNDTIVEEYGEKLKSLNEEYGYTPDALIEIGTRLEDGHKPEEINYEKEYIDELLKINKKYKKTNIDLIMEGQKSKNMDFFWKGKVSAQQMAHANTVAKTYYENRDKTDDRFSSER